MIIDPFGHIPVGRGGGEGVILYSNPSGTTGNITLSTDINNYKYLEVYYERHSHTFERKDYSAFGYPEGFPEGYPVKEEFGENVAPLCVGMVKTTVVDNGVTGVHISWEFSKATYVYSYSGETPTPSSPNKYSTYHKSSYQLESYRYQATASLTGNTFSWDGWCVGDSTTTNCKKQDYRYWEDRWQTSSSPTFETVHSFLDNLEITTCAPKIYRIVAYR